MSKKKDASLYILKYLFEETDEEHGVTTAEIAEYLEKCDISLNPRTIPLSIESINEFLSYCRYMEIVSYIENRKTHYKLIDRPVDCTDVEMMSLALNSVKSLTKKDIKSLKGKLYSLLSRHSLEKFAPALSKKENNSENSGTVSWYLDQINTAIEKGLKISLKYNSKNEIKERTLSPYKLHTNSDGTYILGKCHEHDTDISRFRLDRIKKITILDEKLTPCENTEELEDMINLSKDMSFGEKGTIVFTFTKQIENVVYDRYGRDIRVSPLPNGKMRAYADDYISSTLLGWIFSLGEDIEIEGNQTLLNMMKDNIDRWSEKLQGSP
ncbi:MAG: WYL domain-containing protein [Clostridiales bacterium]|nr:WYL domain-containing protein [Clostridiales bacterium]